MVFLLFWFSDGATGMCLFGAVLFLSGLKNVRKSRYIGIKIAAKTPKVLRNSA